MTATSLKKKYSKPCVQEVEWDFSESICSTVISCSEINGCIEVDATSAVNAVEFRNSSTGEWTRTGSR